MTRRMLLVPVLVSLFSLVSLVSCWLGPEAPVEIQLPPLPEPWRAAFPGLRCLLFFPDGSGAVRSTLFAGWDSGSIVRCDKAGNTAVLAWPVSPGDAGVGEAASGVAAPDAAAPGTLRPAGGLWPGSLVDGPGGRVLRLSWADGATALVLSRLRSVGRDTSLFNAARLSEMIHGAADPWDFDLSAVTESIARGSFTMYDVEELPRRDVTINAGAGDWVLESPFRGVASAGPGGELHLTGISLGAHFLYSIDGRAFRVEVRERETISLRIR